MLRNQLAQFEPRHDTRDPRQRACFESVWTWAELTRKKATTAVSSKQTAATQSPTSSLRPVVSRSQVLLRVSRFKLDALQIFLNVARGVFRARHAHRVRHFLEILSFQLLPPTWKATSVQAGTLKDQAYAEACDAAYRPALGFCHESSTFESIRLIFKTHVSLEPSKHCNESNNDSVSRVWLTKGTRITVRSFWSVLRPWSLFLSGHGITQARHAWTIIWRMW